MEIYLTYDIYNGIVNVLDSSEPESKLPEIASKIIRNISNIDTSGLPEELDTTKSIFYIYIGEEDGKMRMLSNTDFDFAVSILGKLIT